MDLKQSMELAGRNLELCLCPTGNYLPYHKLHVDQQFRAKVLFYDVGHNTGRWWDAMLRLEDTICYPIPPYLEAKMLENLMRQLKRRTRVVGVFPNRSSRDRLIGAMLPEIHEEGPLGQVPYFNFETDEGWACLAGQLPAGKPEPIGRAVV